MKAKLLLILAFMAVIPFAKAEVYNGTCGTNLTWSLNTEDSTLIIEGSGQMTSCPWNTTTYKTYIKSVNLPDGLTSIAKNAFQDCVGLKTIKIPNTVTSIGNYAFNGCTGLKSVTISNNVSLIGYNVFSGCTGLTYLTIPSSVTNINNSAFTGCTGLQSITIPYNVTNIGDDAFSGCTGLKSVTIGRSVKTIRSRAFNGCSNITSVVWNASDSYGWNFGSQVTSFTFGSEVDVIPASLCSGMTQIMSITIPNRVTSIGENAFKGVNNIVYSGSATGSPWGAKSVNGYIDGLFVFSDYTKTTLLSCSSTAVGEIVIPSSVTSIGTNAFYGCSGLTSVIIPNSVTSIGGDAFLDCVGLTSITIPNSVTSIGGGAFRGCSYLRSVTIGNSVSSIESQLFYNCICLTSIEIPNSVERIGRSAFNGCRSLRSVTIGNSVSSIEGVVFNDCRQLDSVNVASIEQWCSISFEEYKSNPLSFAHNLYINGDLVQDLVIPEGVTSIGDFAFYNATCLQSVTMPESVLTIGDSTFYGCIGLTSVDIPNTVTGIGGNAFFEVPNIMYSGSATGSPWGARSMNGFADGYLVYSDNSKTELLACSKAATGEIVIPESVTNIKSDAFDGCSNITSVVWNARNCNYVKFGNQITSFTFGEEVEVIPSNLCSGMNQLTSITVPASVTTIGMNAFKDCDNITSVVWNAKNCTNTSFGNQVTSFVFGEEVEVIPANLCYGMNKLTSITIPKNVMSIAEYAFSGCDNITSVVWNAKNCGSWNFGSQVASFTFGDSVEVIPASICYNMYKLTSVVIPNSVTSIGNDAFSNCSGLTSVTIGNNVTSIGAFAFCWCYSLASIIIPNSVTSIGTNAFFRCSGLTSVTIPDNVTSIGDNAFYGCSGLTAVSIGKGVASIGSNAFYDCDKVTTVIWNAKNSNSWNFGSQVTSFTFGKEVEMIPDSICYGMNNLTSISIPKSATTIGNSAFSGDSALKSVTIGNGVTSIGENAFKDCVKLTSITIPASVTEIGASAFMNGNRLQTLTLGSGIETIGESAFASCPYLITIYAYMEFPPLIDASVFADCGDLSIIDCYVPEESFAFYKKTDVWKEFNLKASTTPEPEPDPEETPIDCTVNYVDKDDALVGSEQVTFHVPEPPVFLGFTFVKWRFVEGDVANGLTIQAIYEANDPSSTPEVVVNPSNRAQKLIRNGTVYILTDDSRTYTITGTRVK